MNDSKIIGAIKWQGEADWNLVKRDLLQLMAVSTLWILFMLAVIWNIRDNTMGFIISLVVLLLVICNMIQKGLYFFKLHSGQYIIDEIGPGIIITHDLLRPSIDQINTMFVQKFGSYANLIWERAARSAKGGLLLPPEGFFYVSDYQSLIKALQYQWPEIAIKEK